MKQITDNIWNLHKQGKYIVIPINGYIRKDGAAVMGRGLAYQASRKYPLLELKLGVLLDENYNKSTLTKDHHAHGQPLINQPQIPVMSLSEDNLIFFPVKYNWWESANLTLIEKSCKNLLEHIHYNLALRPQDYPIYLPRVGCGNGKLKWAQVEPILNKYLNNESQFIICDNGDT